MKTAVYVSALTALLLLPGARANSAASLDEPPILMGVLGDSISAATLADTQGPRQILGADDPDPREVVENKKNYSWASGQKIASHAIRLHDAIGRDKLFEVSNVAKPGAKAEDLLRQAKLLTEQMKSGKYSKLAYVTLMIGANDVCGMESPEGTPAPKFREDLRAAFAELAAVHQADRIHILVSSMPMIPDLGRAEIRKAKNKMGLTCDFMRSKFFRACSKLVDWKDEAEYQAKASVVRGKNLLMRAVSLEASLRYPNLEIVFSESFSKASISPGMLAVDCFHPSQAGQQIIAEGLWKDQPWY